MDQSLICNFVSTSYWGKGRTHEEIIKSIQNSYPVALFFDKKQIGFARAISDQCYLAYVCDVFIVKEFRKQGYSRIIMDALMDHPKLRTVTKWMLATRDAKGLYEKLGFQDSKDGQYMVCERNYYGHA